MRTWLALDALLLAALLLSALLLAVVAATAVSAQSSHDWHDWTVTSNADAGAGTLRAAIDAANQSDGDDLIRFESAMTIRLRSALPSLTDDGISIDARGASVSGVSAAHAPSVWLEGSDAGDAAGLELLAARLSIHGLGVVGFQRYGIGVIGQDASDAQLTQNWIGVRADASVSANQLGGVAVLAGASGAIIRENRIAGNSSERRTGHGVVIGGGGTINTLVADNVIGIAPDGSAAPNDDGILVVDSAQARIEDNVIGHSKVAGIELRETRLEIVVRGNWIGVTRDGTAVANNVGLFLGPGSSKARIGVDGASEHVGGPDGGPGSGPGRRGNVIAANRVGIAVEQGAREARIQANWIGLVPADADANLSPQQLPLARSMPNRQRAVSVIRGAAQVTIANNAISAGEFGVVVADIETTQVSISDNRIAGSRSGRTTAAIDVRSGTEISIGGGEAAFGNQICGAEHGIRLGTTDQARVMHNAVGSDAAREITFDSDDRMDWGIRLQSGVTQARVQQNHVAGVSQAAISVVGDDSQHNRVTDNRYGNNGIDFDLGADGVTQNDDGDRDRGPNGLLNHPVIEQHEVRTRAAGFYQSTFQGRASPGSRIEVYEWRSDDIRIVGRGRANAHGQFTAQSPLLPTGPVRALAVTARGATSEFSPGFMPSIRVKVTQGVNQIAWTGPQQPIEQAMAPLRNWLQTVWRWDAETQRWDGWSPQIDGGSLDRVRNGDVLRLRIVGRIERDYFLPSPSDIKLSERVALAAGDNNAFWMGAPVDPLTALAASEAASGGSWTVWQWDQGQWRQIWPRELSEVDPGRWSLTPLWIATTEPGELRAP